MLLKFNFIVRNCITINTTSILKILLISKMDNFTGCFISKTDLVFEGTVRISKGLRFPCSNMLTGITLLRYYYATRPSASRENFLMGTPRAEKHSVCLDP